MVAVTYAQAHRLVRQERGRAARYTCAWGCGRRAVQWAYVGPREPSERYPWSLDVTLYAAMCLRCHRAYDRAVIRALDRYPADAVMF